MKRPIIIFIVIAILLILILPVALPFIYGITQLGIIPHGYDGVIATTLEVEHDYEILDEYNTGLAMGIDPYGAEGRIWSPLETGLRLSITSPQYVRNEDRSIDPFTDMFFDTAGTQWTQTTTQKVSLMTFEMSMILSTYGDGFGEITDVTFWIELSNNDFSVFTGADDVAISVINVYNMERPYISQTGTTIDFEPESGGADYPLHSMEGSDISSFPDWATGSYNVENLRRLSNVKFPLYVLEADPTTVSLIDWTRVECQVEFTLGIDVMVFGEWRDLKPYREVEPPDPDLTWWDMVLEFLSGDFLDFILLLAWVIVGFVATIMIFRFVPGMKMKLLATAIVWIVLIAIFGISAITVWLEGAS